MLHRICMKINIANEYYFIATNIKGFEFIYIFINIWYVYV